VYNTICYTLKTFQKFFYMQETNILSSHLTQLLPSLMLGQKGPKHVGVSGFCDIIVNQIQLCAD